jgi:hypothetical protein
MLFAPKETKMESSRERARHRVLRELDRLLYQRGQAAIEVKTNRQVNHGPYRRVASGPAPRIMFNDEQLAVIGHLAA